MTRTFSRLLGIGLLLGPTSAAVVSAQSAIADDALLRAYQDAVAERGHEAVWQLGGVASEEGAWIASNLQQGFTSIFRAQSVSIVPSDDAEARGLQLALDSWGRTGALQHAAPTPPETTGNWTVYRRGELIEWYRNDELGLEQGFTVLAPPERDSDGSRSMLELRLSIAGDLQAELLPSGGLVFLDDCGKRVLSYAGLLAWDAAGNDLAAELVLSGATLSIRVDDEDALYPITVDPLIASFEAKLVASDPVASVYFGEVLTIDGDTAVVVRRKQPGGAPVVYVFVRSGGTWTEQARFEPLGFGHDRALCADLDGDSLAVGYQEADDAGVGTADVYQRSGSIWSLDTHIFPKAYSYDIDFPDNVAIAGDRCAVSDTSVGVTVWRRNAPHNWTAEWDGEWAATCAMRDDLLVAGTSIWRGTQPVRINRRVGTTWSEIAAILPLPPGEYPLAIDEEHTIAVGVPWDDDAGTDAGAVYLFARTGPTTWTQIDKVLSPDYPSSGLFGSALTLSSGTLAVGCANEDSAGLDAGAVYLFRRNGGWTQAAKVTAPDALAGDGFGAAVSLDGDTLLAGAPRDDAVVGANSGSAYVFTLSYDAEVYCTAKVNSLGCLPEIDFVGAPSVTNASPFTISARQVLSNKLGIFYYGVSGRAASPFQDGTRCVAGPTKRTGEFSSGGNPPPTDCSGVQSIDFNARIQSGIDPNLVAGAQVNGQFWTRDGGVASGTGLSDGVEFKIQP